MSNGNIKESIKRLFSKSYNGERFCTNDVIKRYPQFGYDVARGCLRQLAVDGFLEKETVKNSIGQATYYWKAFETPQARAYKLFMAIKPTEPKVKYRHR